MLFSIIATLPALLLAIAATTTFVRAIDGWFGERTRGCAGENRQPCFARPDSSRWPAA
ncbi:MAG: hypothetical protein AAFY27_06515 [Pseudomonadota bacterium]